MFRVFSFFFVKKRGPSLWTSSSAGCSESESEGDANAGDSGGGGLIDSSQIEGLLLSLVLLKVIFLFLALLRYLLGIIFYFFGVS